MKTNLIIGVLVGLVELALLWGMDLAGVLQSDWAAAVPRLMLFVHASGVIVAMVRLRQREGVVGFARLLGAGLLVSFVAALTAALCMGLFLTLIEPAYLDWVVEQTRQDIADWPEDRRGPVEERLANASPENFASDQAISFLQRGLLLSLLLAAVLRLRILHYDESSGDAGSPGAKASKSP